jgi:hypothetical protein
MVVVTAKQFGKEHRYCKDERTKEARVGAHKQHDDGANVP